jgi:hypothetical protein
MMVPKVFALVLASAVLLTSVMIYVMGGRFQAVEERAYGGDRRPWWFSLGLVAFAALYVAALVGFATAPERTWAAWVLMVVIPVGAALKAGLVILNPSGRAKVIAIEGDRAWRRVALTRAVLVPVFLLLAYYA